MLGPKKIWPKRFVDLWTKKNCPNKFWVQNKYFGGEKMLTPKIPHIKRGWDLQGGDSK